MQLEFAPMINRIISPPLHTVRFSVFRYFFQDSQRAQVNRQVIRPDERSVLSRWVDIMVSLEFRFMQEKEEDGQLVYRLEP